LAGIAHSKKPVTPIRPPRNSKIIPVKEALTMSGIRLVRVSRIGFGAPAKTRPRKYRTKPT
jgi:hypothetical protein